MLNEVITGITQKLDQVFGEGYEINIDSVEQGLKAPCFLIVCLGSNQQQLLGDLYKREQSFDIHYYPQTTQETIREISSVVSRLLMGLEYIKTDGDLLRGTKMRHEVVDGVLHFFVNYDVRIRKVVEPDPLMENLLISERMKLGGD